MNAIIRDMDLETRILIVDDDAGLRSLISSFLSKHGFVCDAAPDPAAMRAHLNRTHYDLIVLDVMMPQEDGLTALRRLQKEGGPPVIMLSAVGQDIDRIVGLEMGADDYLAKPCNPRELLARIRSVLRRRHEPEIETKMVPEIVSGEERPSLSFLGWRMDVEARQLYAPSGECVALTDGEFRLIRAFAEHPRRVLSRDQLLDLARGHESEHFDRAIDVQISRLRRKLGQVEPQAHELIRTVRNEGYLFVPVVQRGSKTR